MHPPVDHRHVAKIRINEGQIRHMLDLPEGTRVLAVQATIDPPSFVVVCENPAWPAQPEDCEAPFLPGHWDMTQTEAGGKLFSRYNWRPDQLQSGFF